VRSSTAKAATAEEVEEEVAAKEEAAEEAAAGGAQASHLPAVRSSLRWRVVQWGPSSEL